MNGKKDAWTLLNSKEWRQNLKSQYDSWPEWKKNAGFYYPAPVISIAHGQTISHLKKALTN